MHMHIWQWRPTTPGVVRIGSQFLLVRWVDLPSLIHLCVGGMLTSTFFLSNLPSSIHRSSQLRYLLPITLLMCLQAVYCHQIKMQQNTIPRHSDTRTQLCIRDHSTQKRKTGGNWTWKECYKLYSPVLLSTLQTSAI